MDNNKSDLLLLNQQILAHYVLVNSLLLAMIPYITFTSNDPIYNVKYDSYH